MLISDLEHTLLDELDPPPPYEDDEEYDEYLFWYSSSPQILVSVNPPAPRLNTVYGRRVAAPQHTARELPLQSYSGSRYNLPRAYQLNAMPTRRAVSHLASSRTHVFAHTSPVIQVSSAGCRCGYVDEWDSLALPVRLLSLRSRLLLKSSQPRRSVETFVTEDTSFEASSTREMARLGYSKLFRAGFTAKVRSSFTLLRQFVDVGSSSSVLEVTQDRQANRHTMSQNSAGPGEGQAATSALKVA